LYGPQGMNERAPVPASPDDAPVSGDQATLAATPEQQAVAVASGPRGRSTGDWVGREVAGRYVVLERLGEGGMGVVYVAEHLHLKRRVAFKVIHPDLAAHEDLLRRFKREALATGQLDHPHIASAVDFGELEGGGAFMVMPLVRGKSLQAELDASGRLPPRRAALIGAQIADALSAAHEVGIIHRDLKPDNVLVEHRPDGTDSAKVLDFGVASLAGHSEGKSVDARPLTQAGTILGTPGYMSPEQATAGEIDHRTDLYALGVILWELCRGERLFDGETIMEIFAKQFKTLPPALELGREAVGRELSAMVARLLAWDKAARPSSAAEVRDALRRIAELPDSRLPQLPQLPQLPKLALIQLPERYRRYHRHALAALGALLVLLVFVLRGDDAEPQLTPDDAVVEPAVATPNTEKPSAPARPGKRGDKAEREPKGERGGDRGASDKAAAAASEPEEPLSDAALNEAREALLRGKTREARRGAAKLVLRNAEQTPEYLQLVADLELTDRCQTKKDMLAKMRALFDPRVLPALERLAEQPRRGCGLLRLSDCLACLRRELDQTIGALEQVETR